MFTFTLAGNPNAGKTSIFNALTGARQRVGNYPGVTVEKKEGIVFHQGQKANIVDLPGTYSLTAYSLDEVVARDFIINHRPDVVIDVIDASNLERNLYLAVQFMELGMPLVLCLNMADIARQRNIHIDKDELSRLLGGIPVVETVGRKGEGLGELMAAAFTVANQQKPWRPLDISYGSDLDLALNELTPLIADSRWQPPREYVARHHARHGFKRRRHHEDHPEHSHFIPMREDVKTGGTIPARWLALKYLEGDTVISSQMHTDQALAEKIEPIYQKLINHLQGTIGDDPESLVADYRYGFISSIAKQCVKSTFQMRMEFSDKVDKVLTHRLLGPLFLLGILYLVYQVVFLSGEAPVEWCEALFAWLGEVVAGAMDDGPLRSLLVDGVIGGLGGVMGFVPLIIAMFFLISLLEDSGYLARVAYLMDRVLRVFGLHGNAVICLISSGGLTGGCGVPGIMAARTLKDPKSRLATILIVPFMNCGAKLPVYGLLIAAFFTDFRAEVLFGLTVFSWVISLLVARLLRSTLLKGEKVPFVMELPPYRLPTLRGILLHTWERIWEYVKRAGTILLAVSIVMWALMSYPALPEAEISALETAIEQAEDDAAREVLINQQAQAALAHTWAGRAGIFMEQYTTWLDLDWRLNVALLGGLAAKEVIVSTLGTAYSMSEDQWEEEEDNEMTAQAPDSRQTLSQRLSDDPNWNPLKALAIMVLVMIYSPCIAVLAVMKRETNSWRWPLFSLLFNTLVGYFMAVAIYQVGKLFI